MDLGANPEPLVIELDYESEDSLTEWNAKDVPEDPAVADMYNPLYCICAASPTGDTEARCAILTELLEKGADLNIMLWEFLWR